MRNLKAPQKPLSFWLTVLLTVMTVAFSYLTYYKLFKPVQVVVAVTDIQGKEQIKDTQLQLVTVSLKDKHPNAVSDISQVAGKIAGAQIFSGEQIITNRLTDDPSGLSGVFSRLAPDETCITFTAAEAKWPNGLREGDTVVAVAVNEAGSQQVGSLKVLGTDKPAILDMKALQPAIPQNAEKITLAVKWQDLKAMLAAKVTAKAFYLNPSHPNPTAADINGGVIDGDGQPAKKVTR